MSAITPLQALRRLVDIARLIDAEECPELYNQLQAELTVAGAVLAEATQQSETMGDCAKCKAIGAAYSIGKEAAHEPNTTLVAAVKSYLLALDQWENSNKAERRVATAEAAMRAALAAAGVKEVP